MAKPLIVKIKESTKELHKLLREQGSETGIEKIKILLTLQQHPEGVNKTRLAELVGIAPNTANTWRLQYLKGGIELLMTENRKGTKKPTIDSATFKKIEARLRNKQDNFTSYEELRQWIKQESGKSIEYQALYKFVNRKLPVKLKVPRKSHIQKDEAAVAVFKKTTPGHRIY